MPAFALDGEIWEIEQNNAQLLITANGKQTTRKFVSAEKAAIQYGKLIAEKTGAGWLPSTAKAVIAAAPGELREPELERAILANLDDRDAWTIYADWYQQQPDPISRARGELIALQLGEDHKLEDAAARHLMRHKAELLGPMAKYADTSGSPYTWRNGFIESIKIANDEYEGDAIKAALVHPSGRFVTALDIQTLERDDLRDAFAELDRVRETLREVRVRTSAKLVGLRGFENLKVLRTLSLESLSTSELDQVDLQALTRLPASLTSLHLRLDASFDESDLAPLFARDDLHIAKLGVRIPALIDEILTAIATGPFAAHLETLDFAFTEPEDGIRDLLENRDRFAKLKQVTVSLDRLTVETREQLATMVRKVIDLREDELADEIGQDPDAYDDVQE